MNVKENTNLESEEQQDQTPAQETTEQAQAEEATTEQDTEQETEQEQLISFKQSELNSKFANEKRAGKAAILKSAGVNNEKELADKLARLNALEQEKMSEDEKKQLAIDNANKALEERNKENARLKLQVSCLAASVNPDCMDDVCLLAKASIDNGMLEDEAINAVLTKYPQFKRNADKQPLPQNVSAKPTQQKPTSTQEEIDYIKRLLS